MQLADIMVKFSGEQAPQYPSELSEARASFLKRVKEAQAQEFADLHVHLGLMVNNPIFSDVVFVCNDGERVRASKIILAGRSDVLKSMLMGETVESGQPEIDLHEISSLVLLSVFEFLYTGTVSNYRPGTWRVACELVVASRFFLLPSLERIARKLMLDHTASVALDCPQAASMLTEAVGFRVLCDEPDVSLRELVTILSSNWSESHFFSDPVQTIHLMRLSEDAFHYLLANTKGNREDEPVLSFEEYLRFSQVIRWCVYNTDNDMEVVESPSESIEVDEWLVNSIIVDEEMALSVYRNQEDMNEGVLNASAETLWSTFQEEACRSAAARLLQNIDFRRIHPVLLAKLVAPLDLISSEEILNACRFQALRRPKMMQSATCCWEHGTSYRAVESGYVICKVDPTLGSAVMMAKMSVPYAIYEWSCRVREMPESFCELGFICSSQLEVEETTFLHRMLSDHCRARVVRLRKEGVMVNWAVREHYSVARNKRSSKVIREDEREESRYAWAAWQRKWASLGGVKTTLQVGSKVVFTLNVRERTSSIIVDGRCYGIVWENLPRAAAYYPSVSLGTSFKGQVLVKLRRGFDIA